MLQSVGVWFGNEAKRVLGDVAEPVTRSHGNSRKNKPGKQWNKRLVAAELHGKRLDEIYQKHRQEYTGDGQANLRTYSSALSALMEELSEEEVAECQELAVSWNTEPAPKEVQRKCVVVSYSQEIAHNGNSGLQRGFRPWQRSSWILPGTRWVSQYSCLFNTRM
jgi:hypothetical protein